MTNRRTKGEGSYFTRQLASGKTQYVYESPSGKRTTSTVSFAEVKKKVGAKKRPVRGVKLADYLVRWLGEYAYRVRPTTHYRVSNNLQTHIIDKPVAQIPVTTLSAGDIRQALAAMTVSPVTVSKIRALLKQALDDAVEDGIIERNPITRRSVKAPRINRSKARALSLDDWNKLVAHVSGTPDEAMILLLGMVGLRRGEVCGLKWSDIDFEGGRIHVSRAVVWIPKKGPSITETKTAGSSTSVDVGSAILDALRRQKVRQKEMMLRAGSAWEDTGHVITTHVGTVQHPHFITRRVKAIQKAAGVPDLGPHALRHTAATLQLMMGTPVKVVQEMLRHERLSTTVNTYIHSVPKSQSVSASVMDQLAGKAK
jgi:integrase